MNADLPMLLFWCRQPFLLSVPPHRLFLVSFDDHVAARFGGAKQEKGCGNVFVKVSQGFRLIEFAFDHFGGTAGAPSLETGIRQRNTTLRYRIQYEFILLHL